MKKSISSFISFNDNINLLTIQDSSKLVNDQKNEGKKLALWSKAGKSLLSSDDFKKVFSNLNFDLVECPYDDFNSSIESKKRIRKAYDRTLNLIDAIFDANESSLKSNLIMPLVGYEDSETRRFFFDHIKEMEHKFKFSVFHGFEREKSTLELADLKKFETIATLLNVNNFV